MTITLSPDVYYVVMAAAGGLVAAGFALWVALRECHRLILAGVVLAAFGSTGFVWSLNNQRPTLGGTAADKPDLVKDHQVQLADWEANADQWARHAWPAFLVVALAGLGAVGYAWNCYTNGHGIYDPRNRP